ncbi:hypothetical protein SASPL_129816 [Salvia splendens]|uniref:Myb proto-oncogene protein, plant n=1 Tax=Salvia splendens TaxID=180675 RepID=A0A8X8ZNU2_SALSN|nr:transcription factor MYB60-like [Salvia splendens]KAG6411732.1 hypothetical protein SASPL_129816 [Salvia splendens]
MGRPPCCDKVGIKKGPWTPEEDIILVSYIQEHGPGNWRAVPTTTGLLRCSKSCRLRWTNYLRPGIKRGNFTPHEEGMIIHLQALLGNKWAAIATYLPQRTDNDIKNYWNTHLKKKLKKFQSGLDANHQMAPKSYSGESSKHDSSSRLRTEENSSLYASSTENISRLLEGWMRSSPLQTNASLNGIGDHDNKLYYSDFGKMIPNHESQCYRPHKNEHGIMPCDHDLEGFFEFDHHQRLNSMAVSSDSSQKGSDSSGLIDHDKVCFKHDDEKANPPLSIIEKWLLDESAAQVEGAMELPPIF